MGIMAEHWIPLKMGTITYYLKPERDQWVLARSRSKLKDGGYGYNDRAYFRYFSTLADDLIEEYPRCQGAKTIQQLAKAMQEAHDYIHALLKPFHQTPPQALRLHESGDMRAGIGQATPDEKGG